MPKQPGKVSKADRVGMLQEVMLRWGKLDKSSLDQRMAAALGCDAQDIKRALYRDLEELVTKGKVHIHYYTRDGAPIDNFDPDIHKNFQCEWSILGSGNKVIGAALLENVGAEIHVSHLLKNDCSVHEGSVEPSLRTRHVLFNINQKFLCIKLAIDSIPIKLLITRKDNPINLKTIEMLNSLYGKRLIILSVPVPNVSRTKNSKNPGHFLLSFDAPDLCKTTDTNSSNGTSIYKLTQKDADTLRNKGDLLGDETVTYSWNSLSPESFQKVEIQKNGDIATELPIVVQASEKFRVLIL